MAVNKSSQSETSNKTWTYLALAMVGLLILLGVSFHEGMGPNMVHFNNDAPYGMIKARESSALTGLTGYWENLNWVGIEQPSGQPELGNLYYALTGTELFCKTFPAFSLFFLGFAGWVLFRTLKFHPLVCFAGALAAAYNTNAFSNACWGLGTWPIARGMILLSLAALFSYRERPHWSKLVLAGAAIGFNIMSAFDTGAIYSIYVAAFAFALAISKPGEPMGKRAGKGTLQVAVIAICAFLLSAHTVMNLIGTQVKGVAGMAQTEKEKEQRWMGATLWSLPKVESLRLVIPGLFGYRMTDPQNPSPKDYWGTVGAPDGAPYARYSGSGEYVGFLVILLAAWALGQSLRKDGKELAGEHKYIIWFCALAGFISLLLAFGRFAPFYKFVYALPYFSTIRNPIKFTNPLHISVLILFGYGLNNLVRAWFANGENTAKKSWGEAMAAFKKHADAHSRKLMYGGLALLGAFGLAAMIYTSSATEVIGYLTKSARFSPEAAQQLSDYSIKEVFIVFALLAGSLLVIWGGLSGWLKPKVATGILLGILAVDMTRANAPWVNFYDYTYRYQSNHIIDFLKSQSPYWRNAAELAPLSRQYLLTQESMHLGGVFNNWLQQHFQYYGIESLDISQMPRPPQLEANYFMHCRPSSPDGRDSYKIPRLWELTSTRFILGQEGYLMSLNGQLDGNRNRFSIREKFQLAAKPGATGNIGPNDVTTVTTPNGPMAVFEFAGALPRATIFTNWTSGLSNSITYTNAGALVENEAALPMLFAADFDPSAKVLIAETIPDPAPPKNDGTNSVSDVNIQERSVSMKVEVVQDAVLLLNDRHSPNWHVYVDGAERPLLRANYLMRAVQLKPGDKEVVFKFEPTAKYLKITFASMAASLVLLVWWPLREKKQPVTAPKPEAPAAKK